VWGADSRLRSAECCVLGVECVVRGAESVVLCSDG
jgi:hypothetical protein